MNRLQWILRMAWRDSRGSKKRWLLSALCISMGVAAVVAIGSLRSTMQRGIDEQSRALLGADFVVEAKSPFSAKDESVFRGFSAATTEEIRTTSMAFFPKQNKARLIQVRAVGAEFPFFGTLETVPAHQKMTVGAGALVDERLLEMLGAKPGDPIKIGNETFSIDAALRKAPGDSTVFTGIAPRVYLPKDRLFAAKLLLPGSLATYRTYLQLRTGTAPRQVSDQLQKAGYDFESVEKKKREIGRAIEQTASFLNLIGLFSLLLGAAGIASAVSSHIKMKAPSLGLLRCLGASGIDAVRIHAVQVIALGLTGSLFGAGAGLFLGMIIPFLARDYLPFELKATPSLSALLPGLLSGVFITFFVSLPALLSLLQISPLIVLREGNSPERKKWSGTIFASWIVLAAGIFGLTFWMAGGWRTGLSFFVGLAVCLGILACVASLLRRCARWSFFQRWPYVFRQGVANLDRPHNRTLLLVLAIGFSVFSGVTLWFCQEILLRQLDLDVKGQANLILFGIQPDQRAGVLNLLKKSKMSALEEVPMVPMRLTAIGSKTVTDYLADPKRPIPKWALTRDYRSSYRDHLVPTEEIVSGHFVKNWSIEREPIPISIEEGIAKDLKIKVGGSLTFDVQGLPLKTQVASIRKVEWRKFRTNFFVIFPKGVLEEAPGTFIDLARAESTAQSADLQNDVVRLYPNISAVDLELITSSIRGILEKVALATRFLGSFSLITTVLIIVSSLLSSQDQRDRESALLQVIGASRRQIAWINLAELVALGLFSAISGIAVAVAAGALLARYVFKAEFMVPWLALAASLGLVLCVLLVAAQLIQFGRQKLPPWLRLRENR